MVPLTGADGGGSGVVVGELVAVGSGVGVFDGPAVGVGCGVGVFVGAGVGVGVGPAVAAASHTSASSMSCSPWLVRSASSQLPVGAP